MSRKNHNPISWVPTVYFAMGIARFVVLNMVSVLMFKGMGIGDAQIALWTSLIMMPWTLKFLWSPFLEMFKTKKFFVVLTQMVTGAGFALVALALQLPFFFAICIALLAVIAFSGATHDVATDRCLHVGTEQAGPRPVCYWMRAFYNIAKIVASGGLVWLAGALLVGFGGVEGATEAVRHEATRHSWMTVMLILAAVICFFAFSHSAHAAIGRCRHIRRQVGKRDVGAVGGGNQGFLLKKHIWYYSVHYPLSPCRGFCHEDCPSFLEGGAFGRWLGTE